MAKAVANGEVTEVQDGKHKFYIKRELEHGKEQGKEEAQRLHGGKKLDPALADVVKKKLVSLSWDFAVTKQVQKAIEDDRTIPLEVKGKMNLAVIKTEKLVKDAEKLRNTLLRSKNHSAAKKVEDLVVRISAAEDASNPVSKMLRLHVAPDGSRLTLGAIIASLGKCADCARLLLDEVQVCKNYCK